jgi:hypothetical protein
MPVASIEAPSADRPAADPQGEAKAVDVREDLELVNQMRLLFQRARDKRRPMVEKWRRNYKLLYNEEWGATSGDKDLPEMWPIVASMVGWMTDQRPQYEMVPATPPFSDVAQWYAQLGQDLQAIHYANWMLHDYDQAVENVLWDSNVYGTGFFKSSWDATLVGGLGNAVLRRVDPFTVYPDPAASSFEDMNYIIEARRMAVQECDRRWPGTAARLAEHGFEEGHDEAPSQTGYLSEKPMANPGAIAGVGNAMTAPRYGKPGQDPRVSVADDPGVVVLECWLRKHAHESGKTHDTWRVVVVCGPFVVMDENAEDIWAHGRHPYERYVPIETGEFWGKALVDLLAPAQLRINRILNAVNNNLDLIGNPIMVDDQRSGISRSRITNKPGQRLTKNSNSEVSWLIPPAMHPQIAGDMIQFYKGEMENISGLSAITRGFTPNGRNAQGVMNSVQESAFVRVRLALRNLERALRRAGEVLTSLIVEFYDTPRIVAIVGPTGQHTALVVKGKHFYIPSPEGRVPMRFSLMVETGSSLPTSRQARAAEADTLFGMGALDVQAVLEAHNWPNRQAITARVQALQAAGTPPGPGARQAARA